MFLRLPPCPEMDIRLELNIPNIPEQEQSGVAQWLACWAHNPKVRGSKPRSAIQVVIVLAFPWGSLLKICAGILHLNGL